jgi:nucleoside-diphosphate-sugar epimerase
MTQRKCVLLTGATGVIGSALRTQLTGHRVISLAHHARAGADSVTGDLTQPQWGLPEDTYRALSSTVDTVVHCAAVTDFAAGVDTVHRLNVAGTRHVAEFVADADARLIHVSTAFVARAELTRGARGAESREAAARPEDYLDSKREGEAVLRAAGVPVVIARPSVVIGDSTSGQIARFQGVHTILSAVLKNRLPLVPFNPSSRVDVIPQDLVAGALRALVESDVRDGEFWLTAGRQALTAGRMIELCLEVADELGIEVTAPRLVSPDMVDRLIRPVFIDPLPKQARRQFDDLMAMAALFAGAEAFPCSFGERPVGAEWIDLPSTAWFESAFRVSAIHLAEVKGIVARPAKVAV